MESQGETPRETPLGGFYRAKLARFKGGSAISGQSQKWEIKKMNENENANCNQPSEMEFILGKSGHDCWLTNSEGGNQRVKGWRKGDQAKGHRGEEESPRRAATLPR